MNRKFFTLLALLCFSVLAIESASAQVRLGVKGGVDVIDHKIETDILKAKNRLGFTIGGTLEILAPGSGWGGEVAVLYGRKEYKIDNQSLNTEISDYNYIQIPLNLKKRFGIVPGIVGIYASAGPYAAVKISGGDIKIKDTTENTWDKLKAKDFELGVNAAVGVNLFNNIDLGVQYRCGLTENYSTSDPEWDNLKNKKMQTWSVGLTYYF